MRPITCIIVDDEPLAVRLLESYVEKTSDLQLLASFTDSITAINAIKAHFTDPNKITANDVEVQGVSFTPDPSFVKALKAKISTQNKYGRGAAGRNKPYTREQIVEFLDNHLKEHHSITRKQMQYALNITEYRAQKWLDELTAEEFSKYYCKKQGTYVSLRRKNPIAVGIMIPSTLMMPSGSKMRKRREPVRSVST